MKRLKDSEEKSEDIDWNCQTENQISIECSANINQSWWKLGEIEVQALRKFMGQVISF